MLYLPKNIVCPIVVSAMIFVGYFVVTADTFAKEDVKVSAAPTDWRTKLGTFRVGIVGGNRAILNTKKAQAFRIAMEKALKMPVELFATRDQRALVDAQMNSRVEYAIYSATSYGVIWNMCKCVEPLAVPTSGDGASGFRSVLLAKRKDVSTLTDLNRKKVAVPGKGSFSGYLFPKFAFSKTQQGFESYGWHLDYQETSQSAVKKFANNEAAGLFGWEPVIAMTGGVNQSGIASESRGTITMLSENHQKDVHVVWRSNPIPHGPHAVRKGLHRDVKKLLSRFLVDLARTNPYAYGSIAPGYSGGFVEVEHELFEPVIKMVKDQTKKVTSNPGENAELDDFKKQSEI